MKHAFACLLKHTVYHANLVYIGGCKIYKNIYKNNIKIGSTKYIQRSSNNNSKKKNRRIQSYPQECDFSDGLKMLKSSEFKVGSVFTFCMAL